MSSSANIGFESSHTVRRSLQQQWRVSVLSVNSMEMAKLHPFLFLLVILLRKACAKTNSSGNLPFVTSQLAEVFLTLSQCDLEAQRSFCPAAFSVLEEWIEFIHRLLKQAESIGRRFSDLNLRSHFRPGSRWKMETQSCCELRAESKSHETIIQMVFHLNVSPISGLLASHQQSACLWIGANLVNSQEVLQCCGCVFVCAPTCVCLCVLFWLQGPGFSLA